MKLLILVCACAAALVAAVADVAWPADFAEQVAANHPAPSGAQIATSAPLTVDARMNVADVAATPIAAVEGRVTSFDVSDEANIDARRPSGLYIILR